MQHVPVAGVVAEVSPSTLTGHVADVFLLWVTCSDSNVREVREGSKSDLRSAAHKVLGAAATAGEGAPSPDPPSSSRRRGAALEVGG
jgi:hypothetical protein